MLNKPTAEQINHLTLLKQSGEYRNSLQDGTKRKRRKRTHKEILLQVLLEYLQIVGTNHFKSRYFRKEKPIANGHVIKPLMYDCPLTPGEVGRIVSFGKPKGLFIQDGMNWYLKEGMQNHEEINTRDGPLRDLR